MIKCRIFTQKILKTFILKVKIGNKYASLTVCNKLCSILLIVHYCLLFYIKNTACFKWYSNNMKKSREVYNNDQVLNHFNVFQISFILMAVVATTLAAQAPQQPGDQIPIIRFETDGPNVDGTYKWL